MSVAAPGIPPWSRRPSSLDLGVVGNCSFSALIDRDARVVWSCVPGFDGDPVFCSLLEPTQHDGGYFAIELDHQVASEQAYLDNTPILRTVLHDDRGGSVEVLDFAPRFKQYGRVYHPVMMLRRLRPLSGAPRIRVRLRPLSRYGAAVPERRVGSNHARWLLDDWTLRLNTDIPLPLVLDEHAFLLDRESHLVLGPDETLPVSAATFTRDQLEQTQDYWFNWVRNLSIPVDWQDAVIRSAITLKLCQDEGSGAIVAAMTTSIPEHADSGRNWDYRFCWLRDAAFVVRALNRLGATRSMEEYIRYIFNIAGGRSQLAPVYGIHYQAELHERVADSLAGYRGMGPVRVGNDAWRQVQHDVHGSVVLAASQAFFDRRLATPGDVSMFRRLVPVGQAAAASWNAPDAGLWEYRGRSRVHTYSSVMCWAACDRLAKIAQHLGLGAEAIDWRGQADVIRAAIIERSWSEKRQSFVESADDLRLDASALLLADVGFVAADDPRFAKTVDTVGRALRRGDAMFRYEEPDDFGMPATAFNVCTWWYVDAMASIGQREQALDLFARMLERRNHLGLMSEDLDPANGEAWGNFPQTYSAVGLITAAMRLSRRWEDVV